MFPDPISLESPLRGMPGFRLSQLQASEASLVAAQQQLTQAQKNLGEIGERNAQII